MLGIRYGNIDAKKQRVIFEAEEPQIKVAIVQYKGSFTREWRELGVYLLLYKHRSKVKTYIGKGVLSSRAGTHRRDKQAGWDVGIFIKGLHEKLNPTPCHYLEYRLINEFSRRTDIVLVNEAMPSEIEVREPERRKWDRIVDAIPSILYLAGYKIDSIPPKSPNNGPKQPTLLDLINTGLVDSSEALYSTSDTYPAKAIMDRDGSIFISSKKFTSLSGAAKYIRKKSSNGWDFWHVKRGDKFIPLSEIRDEYIRKFTSSKPKGKPKPTPKPSTKPKPKRPNLGELIDRGHIKVPAMLHSTSPSYPAIATLESEQSIVVNGKSFRSLSPAGRHITKRDTNGYTFWGIKRGGEVISINDIRDQVMKKEG